MSGRGSVRNRLALAYAALAMVAVAIVLAVVYLTARSDQIGRVEQDARAQANGLAKQIRESENEQNRDKYLEQRRALGTGRLLALVQAGRVAAANGDAIALTRVARSHGLLDGGERQGTIEVGGKELRVAVEPITGDRLATGGVGLAVAAVPLESANAALASLLRSILLAGGIGILITAAGAWLVARRTLRPLEAIAATASRVAADDLSPRTGAQPRDEIGEVGAAIDRMLHRLEEAFAAQERFLQDASHELRTPLTVIRGHLEVLAGEEAPDPEDIRATLALALDELERMSRLVDGLLQLARATEPDQLRPQSIEVGKLLDSVVAQLGALGDRRWLVRATPGVTLEADPDALRQIIANLVRNAVEHSPPGSVIELRADRRGSTLELEVRDHGEGIDPSVSERLFERFAHGRGNGLGLGLAISKALVDAHGGRIRAENAAGGGSRFLVELPVKRTLIPV